LLLPALALLLTLAFFWRLALTDQILARGDTYTYFYPYWHVRNAALAQGRLPLWSPDIFMGVPLLANSQIGALYPPNWPLAFLSAPDAVRVSLLAHVVWAFIGAYLLARTALGVSRASALVAAVLFAFSGHVAAHVEQINQLQGLAWMPWAFLLFGRALDRPALYTPLLAMALALQFLSGHTQTVFITGIGLGIYGLAAGRWRFVPVLVAAVLATVLLAAPQLAPTLELTDVSNRRGGFNQNQATAFSFSPLVAGRGLLPSYDEAIFGEYIGYPGLIGLGLALAGLLDGRLAPRFVSTSRRRWLLRWRLSQRAIWAIVALAGLLLAFGLYNPLYWSLAALPGFNLFRVPARWLALFALGVAMLAALGCDALAGMGGRKRRFVLLATAVVAGFLAALSPLATRAPEPVPLYAPTVVSVAGWAIALLAFAALVAGRLSSRSGGMALALVVVELLLASQALPYHDLTPPQVWSAPRFTIDQMRAYGLDAASSGRFLSISNLLFDPGDRTALEARYAALGLSPEAVRLAFVAIKMQETLAANLPLVWETPTIDGFDGGLLPTGAYTAFTSLLLPPDEPRTIDGRLRELLARPDCRGACIPDQRWLNLTNTRYLITDKIYDLWHEDVAYDTQFITPVTPQQPLTLSKLPDFEATAVDVLYRCDEPDCSPPAVSIHVDGAAAISVPAEESPQAVDAFQLARYAFSEPLRPASLMVSTEAALRVAAVTLVDTRTGDFLQTTPEPWTRVLSSDIKIYENAAVLPRAFVVHDWRAVPDSEVGNEAALDLMRDPAFDPARTVVLSGDVSAPEGGKAEGSSRAMITHYSAEQVEINVEAVADGYLLLTDAYYPGWQATVNGEPAPLLRADVMFRAVPVATGSSRVVFTYEPSWLAWAPALGLGAWAVAAVLVAVAVRRRL